MKRKDELENQINDNGGKKGKETDERKRKQGERKSEMEGNGKGRQKRAKQDEKRGGREKKWKRGQGKKWREKGEEKREAVSHLLLGLHDTPGELREAVSLLSTFPVSYMTNWLRVSVHQE